jgi:hypothetical protein
MINEDLIRRVVAAIEAQPHKWDQGQFVGGAAWNGADPSECGTTFCFAGWALHLENRLAFDSAVGLVALDAHGKPRPFDVAARDLLGLTEHQAERLFYFVTSDGDEDVTLDELKGRIFAVTGVELS